MTRLRLSILLFFGLISPPPEQTQTTVRVMEGGERIEELAEMIGGQRITDTTRAQANEMLDAARAETTPKVTIAKSVRAARNGKPSKAAARRST